MNFYPRVWFSQETYSECERLAGDLIRLILVGKDESETEWDGSMAMLDQFLATAKQLLDAKVEEKETIQAELDEIMGKKKRKKKKKKKKGDVDGDDDDDDDDDEEEDDDDDEGEDDKNDDAGDDEDKGAEEKQAEDPRVGEMTEAIANLDGLAVELSSGINAIQDQLEKAVDAAYVQPMEKSTSWNVCRNMLLGVADKVVELSDILVVETGAYGGIPAPFWRAPTANDEEGVIELSARMGKKANLWNSLEYYGADFGGGKAGAAVAQAAIESKEGDGGDLVESKEAAGDESKDDGDAQDADDASEGASKEDGRVTTFREYFESLHAGVKASFVAGIETFAVDAETAKQETKLLTLQMNGMVLSDKKKLTDMTSLEDRDVVARVDLDIEMVEEAEENDDGEVESVSYVVPAADAEGGKEAAMKLEAVCALVRAAIAAGARNVTLLSSITVPPSVLKGESGAGAAAVSAIDGDDADDDDDVDADADADAGDPLARFSLASVATTLDAMLADVGGVGFAKSLDECASGAEKRASRVLLAENVAFHPEENNVDFATESADRDDLLKKMCACGDIVVMDSLQTSCLETVSVAGLLNPPTRIWDGAEVKPRALAVGPSLEQELSVLSKALEPSTKSDESVTVIVGDATPLDASTAAEHALTMVESLVQGPGYCGVPTVSNIFVAGQAAPIFAIAQEQWKQEELKTIELLGISADSLPGAGGALNEGADDGDGDTGDRDDATAAAAVADTEAKADDDADAGDANDADEDLEEDEDEEAQVLGRFGHCPIVRARRSVAAGGAPLSFRLLFSVLPCPALPCSALPCSVLLYFALLPPSLPPSLPPDSSF